MTLIADIVMVAEFARSGYREDSAVGQAASRILSAHRHGGLPKALIGQAMQTLESRLVTFVRETTSAVAGDWEGKA